MHRFYLPPAHCQGPVLTLTGPEAHHAFAVLRVKQGDDAAILDGAGSEYFCVVRTADRRSVTLEIARSESSPAPPFQITVLQGIPKGKLLETIIQKATELGVFRIIPMLTERVVTRLENDDAPRKAEKWQHTAIEAIKQCGQRWLPVVEEPITLPALMELAERFDLSLVGSLRDDARHPREYFRAFQADARAKEPPVTVGLWIGPEGDFSDAELEAIRGTGARPISLGPLVLRSDTAALYALSIISYELQASALI